MEHKEKIKAAPSEKKSAIPAAATIVVNLPAEAKLTFDGETTATASTVRTFETPTLENGKAYYYVLKAEIVREGKTVVSERKVSVQAGTEAQVNFDFPTTSVAQK